MLDLFLIVSLLSSLYASAEHVIVVGAGASGLTAAQNLISRGIDVTILEGGSRIGGRGYTKTTTGGNKVDLGCQWLESANANPLITPSNPLYTYAILRPSLYTLYQSFIEDPTSWKYINKNGIKLSAAESTALNNDVDIINARIYNYYTQPGSHLAEDQPFNETILMAYNDRKSLLTSKMKTDISYLWFMFESLYCSNYLSTLGEIGTLYGVEDDYILGDFFHVKEGYGSLIASALEPSSGSVRLFLNSVVTGIDYTSSSKVTVSIAGAAPMQADAVIVTVSIGVLKSGSISFNPAPPQSFQTSLSRRRMGAVDKFVLVFDEPFWPNFEYFIPEGSFLEISTPKYFTTEAPMFIFICHENSIRLKDLSDQAVVDLIMDELKYKVFPGVFPFPALKSFVAARWTSDPLFLGGWSTSKVGTDATVDFTNLYKISNRVHFAGEHTNRDYFGTVNGAMESGDRAADQLADIFNWRKCNTILNPLLCNDRCQWSVTCKPRLSFGA